MNKYILGLFILLSVLPLPAQRQKKITSIACVDVQRIIDQVSRDRVLVRILEDNKSEYVTKAMNLAKEIETLKLLLENEAEKLSEERRVSVEEELQFKEDQLRSLIQSQNQQLRRLESQLSDRVLKSIYQHIEKVATRDGFSMVIEKGTAVVYSDSDIDITDLVIESILEEKGLLKDK